ncbi:hypothetical protein GQ607_008625 [Colletotrichum asianum]|uniref:Uncharacterized protein n=1 Tax=Colletotrichum asianum TaxID=702518 RepID=A0A8H3WD67_9PEZI|nr:hypothetical protein GQ607_008625 [Colletotrichum asianum]
MSLPSFLLWQTATLDWPKGAGCAITPAAFALSHLRTLRKPHFPRLAVFGLSTMTPLLHRMRGYLSSSVFPAFFSSSPRTLSFAWIFRDRQNLGKGNIDAGWHLRIRHGLQPRDTWNRERDRRPQCRTSRPCTTSLSIDRDTPPPRRNTPAVLLLEPGSISARRFGR